MDDETDFFVRRPLKKTRSKPKAELNPAKRTSPGGSSASAGPSSAANGTDDAPITIDDDDDDDEDDTLESGSGSEAGSEDDDHDGKRRIKRRKKKHTRTLPAWASQAVYRPPSPEPTPTSPTAPNSTDAASAPSTSRNGPGSNPKDTPRTARARERGLSLTPPPPPSPEKLSMARDLVSKVIGSKFSTARAEPTMGGRQTRNSAGPGASEARAVDVEDAEEPIRWDPDLARLMRGEDKRHLREQAKREQQLREERRRQRQPPAAASRANGHTQASQAVVVDGNDTDTSVEMVPRRSATSPTKRSKPLPDAVVVVDSSDDDSDDEALCPAAADGGGAEVETLSLTLQSKLGSLGVTVTPTTRLATILQHFLTHHPQLSVRVDQMRAVFDGYTFTPAQTIADMDVDDESQVEIRWS